MVKLKPLGRNIYFGVSQVTLSDTAGNPSSQHFRFPGRHLEFLVTENCQLSWEILQRTSSSSCHRKPRGNTMFCQMYITFSEDTRIRSKFQSYIHDSSRHIGLPGHDMMINLVSFCSPAIFRKSHQSVSLNSKRFGNADEKIGMGG